MILRKAMFPATMLLAIGTAEAQTVIDLTALTAPSINLTAQKMTATLPDGNTAPMWGFCQTPPTANGVTPPCSNNWAPGPTIIVRAGDPLTINLTNKLNTPTSLVVLGQMGGGLGSPIKIASPAHKANQPLTWPAAGANPPAPGDPTFTPPAQGSRVQSFGTEVAPTTTTALTWNNLKPGTYLYETGTHPSIQAPMGLYGVLVVTTPPTPATTDTSPTPLIPGNAYPNVAYDADATLLFSEIDIKQNAVVDAANGVESNYPPAVNYNPTYFLINGQPFDKTAPQKSAVLTSGNTGASSILVRLINAGLRTHIPSIVGLPMSLVGEDGNAAPGNPKIQNEVLLAASKTYDVLVSPKQSTAGTYDVASYPVFDRQLSLSTGNKADGGMQGLLTVAPTGTTSDNLAGTNGASVLLGTAGQSLIPTVAAVSANADNFIVPLNSTQFSGNVLNNDVGVINAVATPSVAGLVLNPNGSFTYSYSPAMAAGSSPVTFQYCGNGGTSVCATAKLNVAPHAPAPTATTDSFTSKVASVLTVPQSGVLSNDTDPTGYPLTAKLDTIGTCISVNLNPDGSFTATGSPGSSCTFNYFAVNAQATLSPSSAAVTLNFPTASGLSVSVKGMDAKAPTDRSKDTPVSDYSWIIEQDTTVKQTAGVSPGPNGKVIGNSFHASNMPLIASGCTGPISCGHNNSFAGISLTDAQKKIPLMPDQVHLDSTKHYFISVLPGDAADAITGGVTGSATSGHTMGGSSILPGQTTVSVLSPANPLPTAQLSVFLYEDNNPTNGATDGAEINQGLGGFGVILLDVAASSGDAIGQMTYDAFNMPLTNSLLGKPGCPATAPAGTSAGVVYTCPNAPAGYNGDPADYALAGHALIKNLMPLRYDVVANPGAEREGRGERWIQTETLEGTKAQDAFAKAGEPSYFQEFGPPGVHTSIGFVNPEHINAVNAIQAGAYTVKGQITNLHMSRPINVTNYDSHSRAPLAHTTCYVGINSQGGIGPNIGFATCDQDGNFTLTGIPNGSHELVIWDQWLDQIIGTAAVTVANANVDKLTIPQFSWFTRTETSTFMDSNGNGIRDADETGIAQVPTTIRFRDGRISNLLLTDSSGTAAFNELFPLFNWYVTESDTTRYIGTGVNTVVDGGGQVDNDPLYPGILKSNYPTGETTVKQYPGTTQTLGLQGFISQTNMIDWGKRTYRVGENGGITGFVTYTSTRGFDDPALEVQFNWEPGIPRVTVNLYQEITNPDGTLGLKYVTSTTSSSWDDYVNAVDANGKQVNMSCPGQLPACNGNLPGSPPSCDPYVDQTLGGDVTRCYDGFHNWNQLQPAVYDGRYYFKGIPAGKYVVEVVPPTGYEIVKEEDKNILIGDPWTPDPLAPAAQFAGVGNIFILPDQATLNAIDGPPAGIQFAKCVGNSHRVPDYLTMFPGSGQIAPFAGADRPLCNRKEINLEDQMQANADFHLFTPTPISSHYTGMILDDTSNEFNVVSPDFGEKFGVPFVPVSIKDFNGVEISRVYSDEWGMFNGLTPSTWEPNVPNPSGYSPNMLITCMNDPGPIADPNNPGKLITDPLYNPMFSNFCYTNPFMPGATDYLDTPVVPVASFAAGYNPPDCALPAKTPAILRVDSSAGVGPYLPTSTGSLTITALGDRQVPNPAYSGPAGSAPKTISRHYGFGANQGSVTLGGVPLVINSWVDGAITASVPTNAKTGELVVTSADGKSSVDAVTVTIEPAAPVRVSAGGSIQNAIDNAKPGSLILVDAGTYNELVIMWKPVRLQGVGAASVIINAAKYPTQKLDNWRPVINQLFSVDATTGNVVGTPQVDPLPGQEITGGVILLEPSVLGTEEGAGITVLAKNLPANQCSGGAASSFGHAITDSNFYCASSRIDGISVTGGDAGGGIYVNGWAHNLEIANNQVYGNAGAFNGGIRVGQPYLEGQALPVTFNADTFTGFGYDKNVKIHHNQIRQNGAVEANNGLAGAGAGLSMCSGTDNYQVNFNFICGNFSLGDGGGIGHIGLSQKATIANNTILFNQSNNPNGTVSGGGIAIVGEPSTLGGLTVGTGNLTVDANLIQGNFAQAGHGGGIRLQNVNGADVAANSQPGQWWKVNLTNNIIANNVAGYSGGGISLADTVQSSIVNNTVTANDSTATVGALVGPNPAGSSPQPAGISSDLNSSSLAAVITQPSKKVYSNPDLVNNIVWHNRAFHFSGSGNPGGAAVLVFNDYWEIGVLGTAFQSPGLDPAYSILSSTNGYDVTNVIADPMFVSSYFNGARNGNGDMQVAIAADEGGNAVDLRYGPLLLTGDYHIQLGSPAMDTATANGAPNHDVDVQPRPMGAGYDIGADEHIGPPTDLAITKNDGVSSVTQGGTLAYSIVVTNNGPSAVSGAVVSDSRPTGISSWNWSCAPVGINGCGTTANTGTGNINKTLANLAVGTSVTFTVNATVNLNATGNIVNTATVMPPASAIDSNTTNNTAVDTDTVLTPSGSFTPHPVSFGNQLLRTTSSPVTLTFTNTMGGPITLRSGTSNSLGSANGPALSFTGGNTNNFAIASGTTCTSGAVIPTGGSCLVNLSFTPSDWGNRSTTLNIYAAGATASFATDPVSGTGITATTAAVLFSGGTSLTTNPPATTVQSVVTTISNTGGTPLVISNIAIAATGGTNRGTYSVANPGTGSPACPIGGAGLGTGQTCQVTVSYTPPTTGALNTIRGTLTLTDTGASTTTQTRNYLGN
jgi:hypothetical protein